jgi:hypothetical protein
MSDKTNYYGFALKDGVRLKTAIFCDGEVIDKDTFFIIESFSLKLSKSNKLRVLKEVFDDKEFGRNYFVYGKTKDNRHVRTYICNIKR